MVPTLLLVSRTLASFMGVSFIGTDMGTLTTLSVRAWLDTLIVIPRCRWTRRKLAAPLWNARLAQSLDLVQLQNTCGACV